MIRKNVFIYSPTSLVTCEQHSSNVEVVSLMTSEAGGEKLETTIGVNPAHSWGGGSVVVCTVRGGSVPVWSSEEDESSLWVFGWLGGAPNWSSTDDGVCPSIFCCIGSAYSCSGLAFNSWVWGTKEFSLIFLPFLSHTPKDMVPLTWIAFPSAAEFEACKIIINKIVRENSKKWVDE